MTSDPANSPEAPDLSPPGDVNDQRRLDRQLENITRILIESYEQSAVYTLLVGRDSDLRTGGTRITTLAAEMKSPSFWLEAWLGTLCVAVWPVVSKFIPDAFGESVRALLAPFADVRRIEVVEARDFGAAVLGIFLILVLGVCRRWWSQRRVKARKRVIEALQKVSELYIAHSAMNARLQRAGHQRVQTEAKLHPFAGMTWKQIENMGDTLLMRRHLDVLADIDSRCAVERTEFDLAGGDYWLELLRAGLRGELPLVVCLYVVAAREAAADRSGRAAKKWRRQALQLCRAEGVVFGETAAKKATAYGALERRLRGISRFSSEELHSLLHTWRDYYPIPALRDADHRLRFEKTFPQEQ